MTPVRTHFAIFVLLVAAGCSRQAGKSAVADAASADPAIISEGYGPSVAHDPRAMTSIDVATGDLSALTNYGSGASVATRAGGAKSFSEQPVLAALDAPVVEQSGAADQPGAQPGPAAPAATTENAAVVSEQAPAATAGPETAQPAQ